MIKIINELEEKAKKCDTLANEFTNISYCKHYKYIGKALAFKEASEMLRGVLTELTIEELATYKKALELLAEDSTNTSLNEDKQELIDYYLQRARED